MTNIGLGVIALQLGHGVPAVETAFKAADWRAIYKLQLGHGVPAVETSGTPRRGRGRLPSARCRALDTARAGRAPSGPRGLGPPAPLATEYPPKEAP